MKAHQAHSTAPAANMKNKLYHFRTLWGMLKLQQENDIKTATHVHIHIHISIHIPLLVHAHFVYRCPISTLYAFPNFLHIYLNLAVQRPMTSPWQTNSALNSEPSSVR